MLLTISLLCSGRESTTEKCLKSIREIADKVGDSEIIVVDTGCDEMMRKLLNTYANKVIPFTWCNDFSAARNVGVDAASGEWFMFIDDDEWFDDPTPVIDFFTSDTYQKYTHASYKVRNYSNFEGTKYNDSINTRLLQLKDKTHNRFLGKVHEYIDPVPGDMYLINCHAEHYGYAFKTDEDRKKHSLRNTSLLEEMCVTEPDQIRWPQQLVPEYFGLEQYAKMNDLCQKTLTIFKDNNYKRVCLIRPIFYICPILGYMIQNDYTSSKLALQNAFEDARNSRIAVARLCELGTKIYWNDNQDYDRVLFYAQKFLEIYISDKSDQELIENDIFAVSDALLPSLVNETLVLGMVSAIYQNQPLLAQRFHHNLITTTSDNRVKIPSEILDTCNAIVASDYDERTFDILVEMVGSQGLNHPIINRIKKLLAEGVSFKDSKCFTSMIDLYVSNLTLEETNNAISEFENNFSNNNQLDYLQLKLYESIILKTPVESWDDFDLLLEAISLWSQVANAYFSNCDSADPASQVALKLYLFLQVAGDDFRKAFEIIKSAMGIYPQLDSLLAHLAQQYADFYKRALE